MRVAIDMDGFPSDLPCDPRAAVGQFSRDRRCLAESDAQRGVDSFGFDGNTTTLVQSKYLKADATREWKEIRKFMNFPKTIVDRGISKLHEDLGDPCHWGASNYYESESEGPASGHHIHNVRQD